MELQEAAIRRTATLVHRQATDTMPALVKIAGVATITIIRRVPVVDVPAHQARLAIAHPAIIAAQAVITMQGHVRTAGVAATHRHRRIIAVVDGLVHQLTRPLRISRGVAPRLLHTTGVPKAIAVQATQHPRKVKAAHPTTVVEAGAVVIVVVPHQAVARRVAEAHVVHANHYNFL